MDRTLGPRLKLQRAEEHVAEFGTEWGDCLEKEPFAFYDENDLETGDLVYRVSVDPDVPEALRHLALIIGDAIHNLRSALDLLAWQLVEAGGGRPNRWTMFPIADSWQEFDAGGPKRIKGASEDAIKLLRRVRPYKGGNNALWRLHRLDIADKHRLFFTVGSIQHGLDVGYRIGDREFGPIFLRPSKRRFPLENDDEIYRVPAHFRESAQKHPEPNFIFDIAFGEGEVVKGEPVAETLRELVGAVKQVIDTFAPLLDPDGIYF